MKLFVKKCEYCKKQIIKGQEIEREVKLLEFTKLNTLHPK
jgi:hypothetical protein